MNRGHCFFIGSCLGHQHHGLLWALGGQGVARRGLFGSVRCHSYFFVLLEGGEGVELAGLSHEKEKGTL